MYFKCNRSWVYNVIYINLLNKVDSYQAQLVVLSMQIAWSEGIEAALAAINGSDKMDPLAKALATTEDTLTLLADSVLQVLSFDLIYIFSFSHFHSAVQGNCGLVH